MRIFDQKTIVALAYEFVLSFIHNPTSTSVGRHILGFLTSEFYGGTMIQYFEKVYTLTVPYPFKFTSHEHFIARRALGQNMRG